VRSSASPGPCRPSRGGRFPIPAQGSRPRCQAWGLNVPAARGALDRQPGAARDSDRAIPRGTGPQRLTLMEVIAAAGLGWAPPPRRVRAAQVARAAQCAHRLGRSGLELSGACSFAVCGAENAGEWADRARRGCGRPGPGRSLKSATTERASGARWQQGQSLRSHAVADTGNGRCVSAPCRTP